MLEVLHRGLVDARLMGYRLGDGPLIALTDTLEILPTLIGRPGEEREAFIRDILRDHHARHGGRDYLAILDEPDEAFLARYQPPFGGPDEAPAPPVAKAA